MYSCVKFGVPFRGTKVGTLVRDLNLKVDAIRGTKVGSPEANKYKAVRELVPFRGTKVGAYEARELKA